MSEQGQSANGIGGGTSGDAQIAPFGQGSPPPGTSSVSPPLSEREVLIDAWTEWLTGVPWDVFGTVTFRVPLRREAALRRFNQLCKIHGVAAGFAVAEDTGSKAIRRNPGLQDVHLHFLLCFGLEPRGRKCAVGEICRQLWAFSFEKWGFARIEPFKTGGGAPKYCVKYILKGESERGSQPIWSIYGNKGGWNKCKEILKSSLTGLNQGV